MDTKSTAFSAAVPVPELLDEHNYAEWAIRVQTYLEGQDLWEDIINDNATITAAPSQKENNDEVAIKVRRRRNFMALHVIQTSCGPDAFSEIRNIRTAHAAWQTLKEKYDMGSIDESYLQYEKLYEAVLRGDLIAAKEFLDSEPEAVRKAITDKGETALHIAVTGENALHMVKELVSRMSKEDLGIEDSDGCTALMKALDQYGRSKLAHYLYTRTPLKYLAETDKKGAMLLTRAIYSKNLDLALDLIWSYPRLTYVLDDHGVSPFLALASKPDVFPSGNRLVFWKKWIYNHCIHIDQPTRRFTHETSLDIINDGRSVTMQSGIHIDQSTHFTHETSLDINSDGHLVTMQSVPGGVLLRHLVSILYITVRKYLLVPAKSYVRNLLGIEQLYEKKKIHIQSQELLNHMCKAIYISKISRTQRHLRSGVVHDAINHAVKNGIFEFVLTTFSKENLSVLENITKKDLMSIFMLAAVLYRDSQMFSFLIQCGWQTGLINNRVTSFGDRNDDNILHMTWIVKDSIRFNRSSLDAALQMQRELQWFKKVESIVHPDMKKCINRDGLTPQQLFTKNHENMMEKGEKWMKDTASSCTVVGALIVTIMFAVAFTVPGGYEQTTGVPIFLKETSFMVFIISDTLSLFFSSTSVLIFLGICTSRYAEEDFLEYLPRQMIAGLWTLFWSIATMMITFSSALFIILQEQLYVAIPLMICLAVFPITCFVWIQFPILKDLIVSTYFPCLFNIKTKKDEAGFKQ